MYSPRWGSWLNDTYTLADDLLSSQAVAMIKAAAPNARLVSDTLTGADTPPTGGLHLWTTFDVTAATAATLRIMYKTAPQRVYLDGFVVSGSACLYDTPAGGGVCVDGTPCAMVPLFMDAGSHSLELRFDSPGAIAAAALTLPSGQVLAQTDASWYATLDAAVASSMPGGQAALDAAVAAALPAAPATTFMLEHPVTGAPIALDAAARSPCGEAGALRLAAPGARPVTFSAPVDMDAYGWTAGFGRITLAAEDGSTSTARSCYGALRGSTTGVVPADDRSISMRMVPIADGGWLLCTSDQRCAGYNATSDTVTLVAPTGEPLNSAGAPIAWILRAWPALPLTLGSLALWLDGSDPASLRSGARGTVSSWRDTRDGSVDAPRTAAAGGKAPGRGGLACPVHFSGGASLVQAGAWDWAVPTTLTVVVSQTSGGAVLAATDAGNATAVARLLAMTTVAGQGVMPVTFESLATRSLVQPRSLEPVVITATRASPTEWRVYVNGALEATAALTLPYGSGSETLTIGGATFDGCLHEFALHARALSAQEAAALANYMAVKWGQATVPQGALPPPPPPLPPLGGGTPVDLTSWALAAGTAAPVPATLVDSGNAQCVDGYGELDFNGTEAASGTYTLAFKVATVTA